MENERLTEAEAKQLFERMRKKIVKNLVGYDRGSYSSFEHEAASEVRASQEDFPVYELLLFTLGGLMRCPTVRRREEKIRWTVYGSFEGKGYCVELRKMGAVFLFSSEINENEQRRIVGQLRGMLGVVDDDLKAVAKHQIKTGQVAVENCYVEFTDRYQFFRKKALEAYKDSGFQSDPSDNELNISMKRMMHRSGVSRDGFYFTVAMVDVFFSRLEHLLLLHFTFLSRCVSDGDLVRFMTLPWKERFKEIVEVNDDARQNKLYAELIRLKETIRNPFAHGGSENDGSSLMVQLPGVGPVPASLSGFSTSPRCSGFLPIERCDYETICQTFEGIDEILQSGELKYSFQMIEGGIDAAFDADTRASFQEAISKPDDLAEYIDMWNQRWMDFANFEN